MDRGSNVRSPSLVGGTDYVMKIWGKDHTYEQVHFQHFETANGNFTSPNKQLKDMLSTDFYCFKGFRGKMLDNCLVHEKDDARITFFSLAGVTTPKKVATKKRVAKEAKEPKVKPEVVVDEPAKVEVLDEAIAAADEAIAAVDAVNAGTATESAQDRRKRLDRARKQAKRDLAKQVLAGTVDVDAEEPAPTEESAPAEEIDVAVVAQAGETESNATA